MPGPFSDKDLNTNGQVAALTQALAEFENRFRVFSETSVQGKLVLRAYRPLFANAVAARLLGFASGEELQGRLSILTLMDEAARRDPMGSEAAAMKGLLEGQTRWRRRDGTEITVSFASRPIVWQGQDCVFIAFNDITGLEQATLRAEEALARTHAALKTRNQLLSAVSHHLRTPLHAMMGQLRLTLEQDLPGQARRMAADTLMESRRMVIQIDDILDVAALQTGAPHLHRETLDLADAVDDALQAMRSACRDIAPVLHVDAPTPGQVQVTGDRRRLTRIILAMMEEAIARRGAKALTVRVAAEAEWVAIETACRVGATPLSQASGEQPLDGFVLAALLAQALGGALSAERDAGDGVWRARARLPFARLTHSAARTAADREGLRVLAVDDHAGNRRLIALVLQAMGHRVQLAEDGVEALAALARAAAAFDCIIMDIMMPRIDGVETTRRIRAGDPRHAATPIIALTADINPQTHAEAEAAGVDAVLTKPLEPARLAQMLALLTAAPGSVEAAEIDQVEGQNDEQESDDNANCDHDGISRRAHGA